MRVSLTVALEDQPQTFEREELVHFVDRRRLGSDQLREASSCRHPRFAPRLVLDAPHHPVDHGDIAVEDTRLDRIDGIAPNHPLWLHELHGAQLRRARKKCLQRYA